ncbi:MAG: glycosyl hydrolase 53 family protein [Prevotella sp.]|nr:glycosyl hydrolase 53 family protein [Prevotella sp.]
MKKHHSIIILGLLFAFLGSPLRSSGQARYLGGDISLLTKYEEHGAKYLTADGQPIDDMLAFFKSQGWNSMRVRLFVDPSKAPEDDKGEGVCQDLDYVVKLGKRIKEAGLKLMLDFHYSDTWTDPSQHTTPSAWNSSDPAVLEQMLYDYTVASLNTLKAAGAEPDFIQPGNEITYGMLWPTGHCYPDGSDCDGGTFANFARYLKAGIRGCRETCPAAKIVIQAELSTWQNVASFFTTLSGYSVDYDVIGLSYYPQFHGPLATLEGIISNFESAYPSKSIQIVEAGYFHKWYPGDAPYNTTSTWPATDEGQRKFTADLIEMLNRHKAVDGFYWWFPEANEFGLDWATNRVTDNWYNASLWDNETGRALPALKELKRFLNGEPDGIRQTENEKAVVKTTAIYDLQGRKLNSQPTTFRKGIYICAGRKFVV